MLPTQEYFPDPYGRSEEALQSIFTRVALWMEVEPEEVGLTMFCVDRGHDAGTGAFRLEPEFGSGRLVRP